MGCCAELSPDLCLAVAAKDIDDLVLDDLLDIGPAIAHILAGIEMVGMCIKVFPNSGAADPPARRWRRAFCRREH